MENETIYENSGNGIDAKSVESVIKHSRKVYYGTNSKLKSFKVNQIKGCYKEY